MSFFVTVAKGFDYVKDAVTGKSEQRTFRRKLISSEYGNPS
jgi:hypothetical protein